MKKTLLSAVSFLARILPAWGKTGLYRLGPISKAIRKVLNQISPTGLSTMAITSGGLQGMQMCLDMQTEKDYWLGTYETDLQSAIRKHVQPGWIAYDVGANIGYISLLFARSVGDLGVVFAFEALPSNLDRLWANITLNGLSDRVRVVPGAVVDISNPVTFLIGPSGAMGKVSGSGGRSENSSHSIEVSGISLDDFVYRDGNPKPQVIKMDIEGGEVLALRGMTRLLTNARPLLFLELHGPEAAQVAWRELTEAGYRVCEMTPDLTPIQALSSLDWKAYLVAVP
jgi:FkbM family methyltransferase